MQKHLTLLGCCVALFSLGLNKGWGQCVISTSTINLDETTSNARLECQWLTEEDGASNKELVGSGTDFCILDFSERGEGALKLQVTVKDATYTEEADKYLNSIKADFDLKEYSNQHFSVREERRIRYSKEFILPSNNLNTKKGRIQVELSWQDNSENTNFSASNKSSQTITLNYRALLPCDAMEEVLENIVQQPKICDFS